MKHRMPKPPARDWTVLSLMALLAVLVAASFATLPLKWREFFTAEAVNSTLNSWPASRRPTWRRHSCSRPAGPR
jgi:hypothetical protein